MLRRHMINANYLVAFEFHDLSGNIRVSR
jgi:hypothetical protein